MVRFGFNFQNHRPAAVLVFVMTDRKLHGRFMRSRYKLEILQLYKVVYWYAGTLGDFTNAQKTMKR